MFKDHLSVYHIFKNEVILSWLFQHNIKWKFHGLRFADSSFLIFFRNTFHNEFWSQMWSWFSSEFLSLYFWLNGVKSQMTFGSFCLVFVVSHSFNMLEDKISFFVEKDLRHQLSSISLWAALSDEGYNILSILERSKTIAFMDGFITVLRMKLVFKICKCYFTSI